MAIESGVADTGSACDVVQNRRHAITGEGILGCLKDALAIVLRVNAGFTCRRRWREFHFWHEKTFCNRGVSPRLSSYLCGDYPRFIELRCRCQPACSSRVT